MSDSPEAGYHRLEREVSDGHRRQGNLAIGLLAVLSVVAILADPLEALLESLWPDKRDDEKADDAAPSDVARATPMPVLTAPEY